MLRILFSAVCGLSFVLTTSAFAGECTCPVSGKPASKDNKVAYKGREVYFCCQNCPKAFSKNVDKFAAKANFQLAQTGQLTQVACPLAGRKINPATASKVEGVEVSFCCNNCKGKFDKSDDKIALVFGSLDKGFTTQTECPVSGKAIDITKSVEHDGKKVYFCCPNCPKAFEANPEKFTGKLPQFNEEKGS